MGVSQADMPKNLENSNFIVLISFKTYLYGRWSNMTILCIGTHEQATGLQASNDSLIQQEVKSSSQGQEHTTQAT